MNQNRQLRLDQYDQMNYHKCCTRAEIDKAIQSLKGIYLGLHRSRNKFWRSQWVNQLDESISGVYSQESISRVYTFYTRAWEASTRFGWSYWKFILALSEVWGRQCLL